MANDLNMSDDALKQREIIRGVHVSPNFDEVAECERRIAFLAHYLASQNLATHVLGISGGVDSTAAGRLSQLTVERLRERGVKARFIAMRLPYGEQRDESDAQSAIEFVRPDETLTVDVKPAADAMLSSLLSGGAQFSDDGQQDFLLGNIKARQRMVAQYADVSTRHGVVVGTDHAAESVMGFFTKCGDGGPTYCVLQAAISDGCAQLRLILRRMKRCGGKCQLLTLRH
jgi:NAD+ synthase